MHMRFWEDKRYRYGILGGLVLIFTVLAFWIRILPFPDLAGTGYWSSGGYGCELAHFTSEGRLLSRWKDPQNACF